MDKYSINHSAKPFFSWLTHLSKLLYLSFLHRLIFFWIHFVKLHKLDCPFTQHCLITGVIYETARHMALSFLIIIITMRGEKGESTEREEGGNVFHCRQKLLPRVINSRHFSQLLLCCWHEEWHGQRHAARLQEHGQGLQGRRVCRDQQPPVTSLLGDTHTAQPSPEVLRGALQEVVNPQEQPSVCLLSSPSFQPMQPTCEHQLKTFNFWVARPLLNLFPPLFSDSVTYSRGKFGTTPFSTRRARRGLWTLPPLTWLSGL